MQVCNTKNRFCQIFCTLIFGNMHGIKQQNIHPWILLLDEVCNMTPIIQIPSSSISCPRPPTPLVIGAENFQGYGSPFLLRRCQRPKHPKISPKTPFLCHNFGQAMSKWLLGDVKLAKMASRRCQTQYYEEPRS